MEKIKAPIDEKNVTTDWIDDVFDNYECVKDGKSAVGYINRFPVLVAWFDNYVVWQAILGEDNCLDELEKRLAEFEDPESSLYSERKRVGNLILQSFYFKED